MDNKQPKTVFKSGIYTISTLYNGAWQNAFYEAWVQRFMRSIPAEFRITVTEMNKDGFRVPAREAFDTRILWNKRYTVIR